MLQPLIEPGGGTILHIGAGDCPELADHLASGAKRIVLVEPRPDRVADLIRRTADTRVEVIAVAIAGQDGEADLKIFNIPGLASLRDPSLLLELYPGLQTTRRVRVETLSPSTLMTLLETLPSPVRVILDAPGAEGDILDAWRADGMLAKIDTIELRCGSAACFAGGRDLAYLRGLLEAGGLEAVAGDMTDPDWPILLFRMNRTALAAARTEGKPKETAPKEMAGKAASADSLIRELENKLAAARAELGLALRLQTLASSDLENLRKRHAELLERKESQDMLISQLVTRLEEASGYLQDLALVKTGTPARLGEQDAAVAQIRSGKPTQRGGKGRKSQG